MDFPEFYQQGGLFMHLVTLGAMGSTASILLRGIALRRTMNEPTRRGALDGGTTGWLMLAAVLSGAAGSALGLLEVAHAVQTIPVEHWPLALSRGLPIAVYPATWSFLVMIPIVFAHAIVRHYEKRVRLALAPAAVG